MLLELLLENTPRRLEGLQRLSPPAEVAAARRSQQSAGLDIAASQFEQQLRIGAFRAGQNVQVLEGIGRHSYLQLRRGGQLLQGLRVIKEHLVGNPRDIAE